jgi:hypothetical protein
LRNGRGGGEQASKRARANREVVVETVMEAI